MAGAAHRLRIAHRTPSAPGPTAPPPPPDRRAASGPASRRARTACVLASIGLAATAARNSCAKASRPSAAALRSGSSSLSSTTPSARTSRDQISGSGRVPSQRFEQPMAQLERVVRELQIEERGFGLLELGGGRQHVMGQSRGLGHRDVDDHQQLQRFERLSARRRIRQRVSGIAALHDHRPEPVGVIGQDLLRHRVTGDQAGDDRCAGHRGATHPAAVAEQGRERRMQMLSTGFGEVPGQDPQQFVEVGAQCAVRRLLHAEVLEHRDAFRARDPARRRTQQLRVHTAALGVILDRHVAQHFSDRFGAIDVLCQKRFVAEVFLDQHGGQRGQAPRIGARLDPQVEVGHLRGVGDHRIDDDHRALRVAGDLVEHRARARETLRHPWVLADEHRHLGVLELAAGVPAVELVVDPRLPGLLLRQRTGPVARTEGFQERPAVRPAEVVPLATAAVVEDLVAAVGVADVCEALGDLGDRGVPVDLLVAAVGAAPHRRGQPGAVVLVVVQAQRLVAGVALRTRMVLVSADLRERAAFGLDDDSAVALAEDARGGLPVTCHLQ